MNSECDRDSQVYSNTESHHTKAPARDQPTGKGGRLRSSQGVWYQKPLSTFSMVCQKAERIKISFAFLQHLIIAACYLAGDRVPPRSAWESVKSNLVQVEEEYVIFEDTALNKWQAWNIELVRRQYSGNTHGVINGIGVVICAIAIIDQSRSSNQDGIPLSQNDTSVAQQACNWRWKIEQFHGSTARMAKAIEISEAKQLAGPQRCKCRLAQIVRNNIRCA